MTSSAEVVLTLLWKALPVRTRETLSRRILLLQTRALLEIPLSEVQTLGKERKESSTNADISGERFTYSLLCTCFNEAKTIKRFLTSVLNQRLPPQELIIVDGGSTDRTPEVIKRWSEGWERKKGVKLPFQLRVLTPGRVNIAAGRNLAAAAATSDFLFFSDAGCELDKSWAVRLSYGFVAGSGVEVVMGWYKPVVKSSFARAAERFIVPQLEQINSGTFLPSARSLALRRRAFDEVGGFPEYLSKAGEDSLFGYYLKSAAAKWAFAPGAFVHWEFPERPLQVWRTIYNYARGDAEGGKVFWSYYYKLLRDVLMLGTELLLFLIAALLATVTGYYLIAFAALLLGGIFVARYSRLMRGYQPFQRIAPGSSRFSTLLALNVMVWAQAAGFMAGLRSRQNVERRRLKQAHAGDLIIIAPEPLTFGDQSELSQKVKQRLRERWLVSLVFSHLPAGHRLYEHQFLDSYLRSNFQLEEWEAKRVALAEGGPPRKLQVLDLANDSLSRPMVERLQAAAAELTS